MWRPEISIFILRDFNIHQVKGLFLLLLFHKILASNVSGKGRCVIVLRKSNFLIPSNVSGTGHCVFALRKSILFPAISPERDVASSHSPYSQQCLRNGTLRHRIILVPSNVSGTGHCVFALRNSIFLLYCIWRLVTILFIPSNASGTERCVIAFSSFPAMSPERDIASSQYSNPFS